jgi:TldD protein
MCVQSDAPNGSDHAFADGTDLLAALPELRAEAVDVVRQLLGPVPDGPPDEEPGAEPWAPAFAERHGVRLVCAEYRQRVAVGTSAQLAVDERAARTVEVVDLADPGCRQVVPWIPGDVPANLDRLSQAAEAVRALAALPVVELPATRCDVVLDPGWAGPLFHELVGHPLEADVVAARTSYLADRAGETVAPGWLTVSDGPAPPGEGLTARLDDEGTPARATTLIDHGTVAGLLHDRLTAAAGPRTGHGRRLDYRHPVIPRMWHTRALVVGTAPVEPQGPARLQARGVQLAWMNLLTGDVEFQCANGLLSTGHGEVRRTGPFTLSGNALTLLAALQPGPAAVRGAGRARRGCGKLGQFPLVTTFANSGLWIPGEAVDVRAAAG